MFQLRFKTFGGKWVDATVPPSHKLKVEFNLVASRSSNADVARCANYWLQGYIYHQTEDVSIHGSYRDLKEVV